MLGLGYCSFTRNNYSNHHALGKLAEQLVEKGLLAAAGEDYHQNHGGAGQQPYPVDAGSEKLAVNLPTNNSTYTTTHGHTNFFLLFFGLVRELLACTPPGVIAPGTSKNNHHTSLFKPINKCSEWR